MIRTKIKGLLRSGERAGKAIARLIGLDHASLFGVAAQFWGPISGVVTLFLITHFFTPEIQGLHYTFLSMASLQLIIELGLAQVLVQFASHEWSKLSFENNQIIGDAVALSRLSSLRWIAVRWYGAAALLCLAAMEATGFYLFEGNRVSNHWFLPWTSLCLAITVDLLLLPCWSLLDGCNQIGSAYFMRLVRSITNSIALWIAIALGAGIWSASIGLWAGLLMVGLLGARRHGKFFMALFAAQIDTHIDWLGEVWPMQWRIAVSWLSGYFYFYFFVPVLFKFHGALVAGQLGMTLSILGPISAISGMFVQTKAPAFGKLVSQERWADLDKLALRAGISALAIFAMGAASLLVIVFYLRAIGLPIAFRILPPASLSLFLLASFGTQITLPMSTYLRAHKREPFAALSVLSGVLVGLGVVLLGRQFGAFGMGAAYAGVSILVTVPVGTIIFLRSRAAWHSPAAA